MANSEQDKQQTSVTKMPQQQSQLAMPLDRESTIFSMTPEQHQKMVTELREAFLSGKMSSTAMAKSLNRPLPAQPAADSTREL